MAQYRHPLLTRTPKTPELSKVPPQFFARDEKSAQLLKQNLQNRNDDRLLRSNRFDD